MLIITFFYFESNTIFKCIFKFSEWLKSRWWNLKLNKYWPKSMICRRTKITVNLDCIKEIIFILLIVMQLN